MVKIRGRRKRLTQATIVSKAELDDDGVVWTLVVREKPDIYTGHRVWKKAEKEVRKRLFAELGGEVPIEFEFIYPKYLAKQIEEIHALKRQALELLVKRDQLRLRVWDTLSLEYGLKQAPAAASLGMAEQTLSDIVRKRQDKPGKVKVDNASVRKMLRDVDQITVTSPPIPPSKSPKSR